LNFLNKHFSLLLLLLLCGLELMAQRMISFGPGINRYGVAASVKYHAPSKEENGPLVGDFLLEFGNIQHSREVALINNALQSSGVYKFGKINYAWAARPYVMGKYPLSMRQDKKSVAVNLIGGLGIPLAFSWPVYILLYDPQAGPGQAYTEVRYDPNVHTQALIGGRAPFTRGLSSGKITPGLGLNTGLEFAWGNYQSDVKMLTLGMRLESYSKDLPILYINSLNQQVYSYFYLTFAFGFGKN
jgi:hypothetical protein